MPHFDPTTVSAMNGEMFGSAHLQRRMLALEQFSILPAKTSNASAPLLAHMIPVRRINAEAPWPFFF
jgi:hypothetical protein